MMYENYNFIGMHMLWWFAWAILLLWIFATPYNIPGQRTKKNTPLYILKKRYALGQISKEQYLDDKANLEK